MNRGKNTNYFVDYIELGELPKVTEGRIRVFSIGLRNEPKLTNLNLGRNILDAIFNFFFFLLKQLNDSMEEIWPVERDLIVLANLQMNSVMRILSIPENLWYLGQTTAVEAIKTVPQILPDDIGTHKWESS